MFVFVAVVVVVAWKNYSERIISVRWTDLSEFLFSLIFFGKMCVFVSRPMKNVTFLRENDYTPKRVVDVPWERDTFRNKIMEIVEDFDEKSNNNGKPWKSSRILRVNSIFSFFSIFSFLMFFIFSFFLFFSFFSFFHFFIFSFFPFFHFFNFSYFFIFFHFLSCSFFHFSHFFIFSFSFIF